VLLREERELGTSLIIIDQLASKLSDVAFANTATTIALNQKHRSDMNIIANAVVLDNKDKESLSKLPVGYAVVRQQDRWPKPFTIQIPHYEINKGSISDDRVRKHMGQQEIIVSPEIAGEYDGLLSANAIKLMRSIKNNITCSVVEHYQRAGLSVWAGNEAKKILLECKLITQQRISDDHRRRTLGLTKKGVFYLRLATQEPIRLDNASIEHRYHQQNMVAKLEKAGYKVKIEPQLKTCRPDLLVTNADKTIAVEIETGKSKHWLKHIKIHLSEKRQVVVAATNKTTYEKIIAGLKQCGLHPHDDIRVIIAGA